MNNESKTNRFDTFYKSMKLLLAVAALFIAYLFALNGRYVSDDHLIYHYDKWTNTIKLTE